MALRGRGRDQRGAAAVEFALVAPMLFMLLFGTITSGISYSNAIGVTNAVREGARFGATADAASSSWVTDVLARTRTTQFDDPSNQTSLCVKLYEQGSGDVKSGCSAGAAPVPTSYPAVPAGLATGTCVVLMVANRPFEINAVLVHLDRVLTKSAVARYERETC